MLTFAGRAAVMALAFGLAASAAGAQPSEQGGGSPRGSNDDDRNARPETLPADGTYYAVATSFGSSVAAGAYTLRIERGATSGK